MRLTAEFGLLTALVNFHHPREHDCLDNGGYPVSDNSGCFGSDKTYRYIQIGHCRLRLELADQISISPSSFVNAVAIRMGMLQ